MKSITHVNLEISLQKILIIRKFKTMIYKEKSLVYNYGLNSHHHNLDNNFNENLNSDDENNSTSFKITLKILIQYSR